MNKLSKKFQLQAFALSLMWLVPLSASAQTTTIKGSVCDEKGEPLIGVTVAVKGNKKAATVSDMDGNFVITVSSGKPTLIFSYVGMQDKQVTAVPGQRLKVNYLRMLSLWDTDSKRKSLWLVPSHKPTLRRLSEQVVSLA